MPVIWTYLPQIPIMMLYLTMMMIKRLSQEEVHTEEEGITKFKVPKSKPFNNPYLSNIGFGPGGGKTSIPMSLLLSQARIITAGLVSRTTNSTTETLPTKLPLLATIPRLLHTKLQHTKHHPMKNHPINQAINQNIQDTLLGNNICHILIKTAFSLSILLIF